MRAPSSGNSSLRLPIVRVATLALIVLFFVAGALASDLPAKLSVPIMPLKDVKVGMHGVAYTVFQGTTPEKMDLVVLGILRNATGPRGDVILIRLYGKKPEYTGVVAGMSGSPVYIDGKLVGALALRIGDFSKEPIAGVTPIEYMLEIDAMDSSSRHTSDVAAKTPRPASVAGPGVTPNVPGTQHFASFLTPIETPLAFTGFSEDAIRRFAPQFEAAGILPVMGVGSSSNTIQTAPVVPGSSIGAVLVQGDMDISATCTVTYVDPTHLLACGHAFLNYGKVDMPMTKSTILATLPSPANSFKIATTNQTIGAFVQDRHTGILGRFGAVPQMIPVTLNFTGISHPKTFHFQVLNNARLTPTVMMSTVYNAILGINEYGEDTTFRVKGDIDVAGYPELNLDNMYAPLDGGNPTAASIALAVGERFSRIFDNPYQRPEIKGVDLNIDLIKERRWARLETARTDVTEARPGDKIVVETVLRPYRGDRIVRQIPIRIPTSTPRGTLRILVSDGDTLNRMRSMGNVLGQKFDLGSTIAQLNKEHSNSRLYVSLLEANPQAMVGDKVMPSLPLSVMNVMEGMRGTQDMVVVGESAVSEASTPLNYVVTGAQVITVTIR